MITSEELDADALTQEERIAALKAAKGVHRAAFEKARKRRQVQELAAFFAKDDGEGDADESREMGEVTEFDDDGGGL